MRKYLEEYVSEVDKNINLKKISKDLIEKHLIKINFFQHERLIHLLVTLFYGLFLFVSVFLTIKMPIFIIITFIIMVILIFYVRHYFFLENNVQYLYIQYDKMMKMLEKPLKNKIKQSKK